MSINSVIQKAMERVIAIYEANSKVGFVDDHRSIRTLDKDHNLIVGIQLCDTAKGLKGWPVYMTDKASCFSVNPMYIGEDGAAHLRQGSCGGTVNLMEAKDFTDAIRKYNDRHNGDHLIPVVKTETGFEVTVVGAINVG
jgi:hypothetical protein